MLRVLPLAGTNGWVDEWMHGWLGQEPVRFAPPPSIQSPIYPLVSAARGGETHRGTEVRKTGGQTQQASRESEGGEPPGGGG